MEKINNIMKKLIALFVFVSFSAIGQNRLIKQSVATTPIDSIEVSYKIAYPIEIDGHSYDKPIWMKSSLDGMKIVDEKGNTYKRRKCEKVNCGIIHLEKKFIGTISVPNWYGAPNY